MLGSTSAGYRPIVLKDEHNRSRIFFQANPEGTAIPHFANRLLCVKNQVQENLHQLMGIAENRRQGRSREENRP